MADHESTPLAKQPLVLPADRKMLALESCWEIEVLAGLLLEKAACEEWELEHTPAMILRSLGVRIKALSQVVMSAMDDPIDETQRLTRIVFGECKATTA